MVESFYTFIACEIPIELMIEATEKAGKDWWETHEYNSYGDWDDFFYANIDSLLPLINEKMLEIFIVEIKKVGFSQSKIDSLNISCEFFEIMDYTGVFTAKITGTKDILAELIEAINDPRVSVVLKPDSEEEVDFNAIPDDLEPCPQWDKSGHHKPDYPFIIFSE